jgi:class 3 adenylate cyclase
LICLLFPMSLCLAYYLVPNLLDRGFFIPQTVLVWGVPVATYILIALVFLVALSLSIFYRGTIDPRLAARKVTLIGMLGLIVTTVFIFLERLIATKLTTWLALSPDSGALLAGAVVAMTFNPIRKRTERAINDIMGRLLPLDSVIEGERKHLVVAIADLSGYTALSSRDEKQALLLAALLQRQAAKVTRDHAGRIVKSMGDAVLFAFDDAQSESKALTALHRDFQPAAQQLGLEMLPVHSGAHWGEVTVARDGDLYGQVVNIAARLQASSEAGQIVVSRAFAELARHVTPMRDLGLRQFKNVAEHIQCEELVIA